MKITDDHWLDTAIRVPLSGGSAMPVRRFLVMHFTSGATAKSSIDFWKTPEAKGASAHIVIDRDGTVYQCRPFNRTCGHAGASKWTDPNTGRVYAGLNSCSIGIELANGGDSASLISRFSKLPPYVGRHKHGGPIKSWEQYPELQLKAAREVASLLVKRYNLDDVVGHDDIAPERKVDPGPAFPMLEFREFLGFKGLPKR